MKPPAPDSGARPDPPLIVAIDGPAGAGKSTVARRLAAALGLPFVDTGAMYRAAALHLAEAGVDLDDRAAVAAALPHLPLELGLAAGRAEVRLGGVPVEDRIRTPQVGALTSRAALHPELRAKLVELQREFVRRHGGVMEGRDIGTVVVPETPYKFYLDAANATRAERRHAELRARGLDSELDEVARQIRERDERDSRRESSPLVAAADAIRVSSDGLSAQEVADCLRAEIEKRRSVR